MINLSLMEWFWAFAVGKKEDEDEEYDETDVFL